MAGADLHAAPANLMKLHIGSGSHYADGWVNVDCDPQWRVDLVARAEDLPQWFPHVRFDRVYMGHFLEHLPYDDIPGVIGAVLEVCTQDVVVAVVGPCLDKAIATGQDDGLLYAIRDRGETDPGSHRWTATTELTALALAASGLVAREVPVGEIAPPEWPNPSTAGWQCAFLAHT